MAVEYHLLTAFGTGKAITMTIASPCSVTYTNHGLSDGFKVVFETTGALPTGITAGTTYYAKSTAANTFNLYTDATLTTIVNTSGSQSGTHTIYSEYWYNLPATDPGGCGNYRARYGTAGSERVYATMNAYIATYNASSVDLAKDVICEIVGAWTDTSTVITIGGSHVASFKMTTKVNGVWGSGYHWGVYGSGYVRQVSSSSSSPVYSTQHYTIIEGIHCRNTSTGAALNIVSCLGGTVLNCIGESVGGNAFNVATPAFLIANCLAVNSGTGFPVQAYANSYTSKIVNCMATNCALGFGGWAGSQTAVINCIGYGNTMNWGVSNIPGGLCTNNAGASGDTPWTTSGYTSITPVTADSFVSYSAPVTRSTDLRPASSSAVQVDAGIDIFNIPTDSLSKDSVVTTNSVQRPSYNNGGSTGWDIGPFEFDNGYGPSPSSVSISITGMASGSEIAIYKASDMSAILAPQSTTGTYSGTYTYTGDVNIIVRVRKGTSATRYLPYEYAGTITSTGFQLVVSQIPDTIAQ